MPKSKKGHGDDVDIEDLRIATAWIVMQGCSDEIAAVIWEQTSQQEVQWETFEK